MADRAAGAALDDAMTRVASLCQGGGGDLSR
jgi:hypothetical protein